VNVRKLLLASTLRVNTFVVAVVVALFLMPFVVHRLGDRAYGLWLLLGTFVGYCGLLDLGLSGAVTRYAAAALGRDDRAECNRVFNTALFLYGCLGAIALIACGAIALVASALYADVQDRAVFRTVVLILGAHLAVSLPERTWAGLLAAHLRYDILTLTDLLSILLRALLTVAVLTAGYGLVAMAWVALATELVEFGLYFLTIRRVAPYVHVRWRYVCPGMTRQLASFSGVSFIIRVADILRSNLDSLVISAMVAVEAVTHYNIAFRLTRYFADFMVAVMGILQPVFSRQDGARDRHGLRSTLFFATKVSAAASSFVGFGLITFGRPFIERWMGRGYEDAYPPLVALTVGCMVALWQVPSINLLYGTSNHKYYAISNMTEGVLNLILSLALVRPYGILGVALGTCIPMVLVKLLLQPLFVCRVLAIPVRRYLGWLATCLLRVAASLLAPAALAAVLPYPPDFRSLLAEAAACAALFVFGAWFIVLSSAERSALRPALGLGVRDAEQEAQEPSPPIRRRFVTVPSDDTDR
jgi:O-antigen/teichoic acid export membrane protein